MSLPYPSRVPAPRRKSTAFVSLVEYMEKETESPATEKSLLEMDRPQARRRVSKALKGTSEFLGLVQESVPLEPVKAVIATMRSTLAVASSTMQNKEDFFEIDSRCKRIGKCLLRATLGGREVSTEFRETLRDLERITTEMSISVRRKASKRLFVRVASNFTDKDEIESWSHDLDQVLQVFQAELGIEVHEALHQIGDRIDNLRFSDHHGEKPQRDPPPAMPAVFFGRRDLVQQTATTLLTGQHVVLHGIGGVGKSTMAKAVLNQPQIVERFRDNRFFIHFGNIDNHAFHFETFLSRIGQALGVTLSKSNFEMSVEAYLARAETPVLLTFDNAETFLDAASKQDLEHIGETLTAFANLPLVTILMTSRSVTLPPDFIAHTITVGRMDEETAFQIFRAIYDSDISPDTIQPILSALDFHPLSISLLAQTARQNKWSPKKVVDAWAERHVHLLENEYKGLGETFELSLQSSVIQRHPEALNFLQVVAFLPKGVDEKKLQDLFPDVLGMSALVDTLCNHSLVYRAGDFITMLAPIRLYITDVYNRTAIRLLDDVRRHYYKRLQDAMAGDSGAWIAAEDDNVEKIIALDLSVHTRQEIGCNACIYFIQHLIRYKRRPTALDELVGQLPEDSKYIKFFGLWLPRLFGRNSTMVRKGTCTLTLGLLAAQTGHSAEALRLLLDSKRLFALLDDWDTVCICLELIGQIYVLRGQMNEAKKQLDEGLRTSKRAEDPKGARFKLIITLGWVKILEQAKDHKKIRDFEEAQDFFAQREDTAWVTYSLNRRAYAELYSKNFDAARKCLQEELALHIEAKNDRGRMGSLMALAEVALAEGVRDLGEANRKLDEARAIALSINDMQKASLVLAVKSALSADVRDFALARSQIEQAKREMTFAEENENFRLVWCIYLSARNEFMAREYDRAKILFEETLRWSNTESDMYTAVRSMKALGEISLLQDNLEDAKKWGDEADKRSKATGVASYLHDIKYHCCLMKNSFEGRRLYQDGGLPSPGVLTVTKVNS